jgi:hypothetical protein
MQGTTVRADQGDQQRGDEWQCDKRIKSKRDRHWQTAMILSENTHPWRQKCRSEGPAEAGESLRCELMSPGRF